jgi:hypothetical protein
MFVAVSIISKAQSLDIIKNKILSTDEFLHAQKVFVHSDKTEYYGGDTIWFKAYILNKENKPDTFSTNLKVDLLYPSGLVKFHALLLIKNGAAFGQFILPDTISKGIYIITAYTPFMRNFDSGYYFYKTININSDKYFYFEKSLLAKTKKFERNKDKLKIIMYPEAGNIAMNTENKIIYSIKNGINEKINVTGILSSNKNKEILKFDNKTENYFTFVPEKDVKYSVTFYSDKTKIKKELQPSYENIYIANYAGENNDSHIIKIKSNKGETKDTLARTILYFAGNSQKINYFGEQIALGKETEISIPKNKLPEGINNFTVTDLNGKFIGQLFFENKLQNADSQTINYSLPNDTVFVEIKLNTPANVSVSVTNNSISGDENAFSNNISKYINNYYVLKHINNGALNYEYTEYDYNFPDFKPIPVFEYLKTEKPEYKYENEKGITIEGNLTSQIADLPIKNHLVNLTILNKFNDRFICKTNDEGIFRFKNLFYDDTLKVAIESFRYNQKYSFIINQIESEKVFYNVYSVSSLEDLRKGKKLSFSNYSTTGKDSTGNNSGLHNSADMVIYFNKINTKPYSSALDVIAAHVPGVSANGMSSMRGQSSMTLSSEPLYLIDDVPTSKETIGSMDPNNVERVEILRSIGKSSIYGSSGANGVIAVYAVKGYNIISGKLNLNLTGFQKPLEFNPTSKTPEENKQTTIYWNPNINTDNFGIANISFKIPNNVNSFKIVVQGLTQDGKPVYIEKLINR